MQSFDWHLSLEALEYRDGYFTKLKHVIESAYHQNNKRKVVLVCHSLGGVIFTWFTQFMTARDATWMETYVHANVLLGAPLLGAPKAVNAMLSGELPEMHDGFSILQKVVVKAEIMNDGNELMTRWTEIMRNLESLMYLLPKGGDEFWSKYTWQDESNVSDLSRLLKNPQKMKFVLESELCSDSRASFHERTVESVFGNLSKVFHQSKVALFSFLCCFICVIIPATDLCPLNCVCPADVSGLQRPYESQERRGSHRFTV